MKLEEFNNKYFLYSKYEDISIAFSTANVDFPFNPKLPSFNDNIKFLKETFNLNEIFRASQTHSNKVLLVDNNFKNGTEADGLITDNRNIGIGVFTADCVPIILFDKTKKVISAVHSGWRGTYNEIVIESLNIFKNKFNSNIYDIIVYIGPHNMSCCYEIGNDVREKFSNHSIFKTNTDIFKGSNLNMLKCIELSLINRGVLKENIKNINFCTHCSNDVKFYSYRKDKDSLNRMFSFVFLN